MVLFALFSRNMEWTDAHNIQLAREVLVSEPFRFKPRTVERGKVWQEIANRLNEKRLIHFRATRRSTREHFSLLLEKFKAKRKNGAKQSGVDVQDSELDVAMEKIWEKWQEAESQDATCDMNKKQIEAHKASVEEVRRKACEKLGETSKRKMEKEASEVKTRKSRRYGSDTIEFLLEKVKQDLAIRKEEVQRKEREEERHVRLQEQFILAQQQQRQHQMQMRNMMQQQNRAIIELMENLLLQNNVNTSLQFTC